ncbi:MAG: penicillin-binding protein activator [Acinetobacter populi]|jgi:outer membrane PBP1 activator LpoA protein|uniref:penicillin-binding protein activator n=1 Tax=Acinetobacter populi TaxID=1582270 RepID=UPI0023571CF8|nr:penicillin-binding protein activator [Acinetobacter populi]MCH4246561.1 penicillin-binding protein activator [Acinetobacter populi]
MLNKKLSLKALASLTLAVSTVAVSAMAQAEILVILPETGAMASATDSIKRGLIQANHQSSNKYKFKFVDIHQQPLSSILQKNVSKTTELVIGPLDKQNVEQLLKLQPKIKTLALNQVSGKAANVYQFALSKEEDALALTKRMQWDGIDNLIVLRDPDTIEQTQSFYDAMVQLWGNKMEVKEKLPFFSKKKQGVLLLGSGKWLTQQKLPSKNIYTLPFAIEEKQPIPEGMIYCDTPALYTGQWSDVMDAYKQKPVTMPFQRLIAFGGDAWQIADALQNRKNNSVVEFKGRTGQIRIVDNIISREPQCFQSQKTAVKAL